MLREKEEALKAKAQEENKNEDSDDIDHIDNEEEGGEWITEENLYHHINAAGKNLFTSNIFVQILFLYSN